jgi:hypothetical protein
MVLEEHFSFSALIRWLPASKAPAGQLLWGSTFMVISLLLAGWALKCEFGVLAFGGDSLIVEGTVLRLWVTEVDKGRHYLVAYEYPATLEAGARLLRGEDEIPEKDFARLEAGGPVAITVCRSDPANHLVAGARPRVLSDRLAVHCVLGIVAILAVAGAGNLAWWMCRRPRYAGRAFLK